MRDATEGNSGQGDSLLSLEAEEERIPSSEEDDDAGKSSVKKRIEKNEEKKFEREDMQENS